MVQHRVRDDEIEGRVGERAQIDPVEALCLETAGTCEALRNLREKTGREIRRCDMSAQGQQVARQVPGAASNIEHSRLLVAARCSCDDPGEHSRKPRLLHLVKNLGMARIIGFCDAVVRASVVRDGSLAHPLQPPPAPASTGATAVARAAAASNRARIRRERSAYPVVRW